MTIAEDAAAQALTRRLARSVVIKDAKAWEMLYGQLQTAMTNAWSDAMRQGIAASLDRLRDLGPGRFTSEDGEMILRILEASVGRDAIRAAMREPIVNLTDALFRVGAEEVGTSAGVAIAFMRPDLDALDALKQGNLFWVGESWNAHTRDKLNKVLTEYFADGMTREGLAARIAEDFATVTGKSEVYWEMLADHIATKGREIGRVTGYERAGIKRVQVRAQMDAKTSDVCRAMHGRILEVDQLRDQANAYIEASNRGDKAAIGDIWAMHSSADDIRETATRDLKATGSPPYHYRCRTITVAYFEPRGERVIEVPGHDPLDLDHILERLVQRQAISADEIRAITERAREAAWGSVHRHYHHTRRHGPKFGLLDLGAKPNKDAMMAYTAAALALADVEASNVHLAIRQGKIDVIFERPTSDGVVVTVVGLEDNVLRTHLPKKRVASSADEVPAKLQSKRLIKRIFQWFTRW